MLAGELLRQQIVMNNVSAGRPAWRSRAKSTGLGCGVSVWEPDVQISNGWCKVPIPAGWRGGKALKQNRWFIVQVLFFLIVLQVPVET